MKLKNYLKVLPIGLVGTFLNLVNPVLSQTTEELRSALANPETNHQQLQQDMNAYLADTTQPVDSSLFKTYSRQEAYYAPYLGTDGTINNFYPDFLTQTSANSQPLPNINNCNLPNQGWKLLGPFQVKQIRGINDETHKGHNGRVTSVEIDVVNNIVYAGVENGGLWKKPIGTDDWVNITDKFGFPALGVYDIAINPSNPNDIYCATGIHKYQGMGGYGIGIIHTTDGGDSWVRENVTSDVGYNLEALSVAFTPFAPYTVFAGLGNDLYRKDNSMGAWTSIYSTLPVNPPNEYREVVRNIKFISPTQVGDLGKIIFSTHLVHGNGSAHIAIVDLDANNNVLGSWVKFENISNGGIITHKPGSIKRISVDVSNQIPQKIYASYLVDCTDGTRDVEVMVSSDNGASWSTTFHVHTHLQNKDIDLYKNTIQVSHADDSKFFIGGYVLSKATDDNDDWDSDVLTYGKLHVDIRDVNVVSRNGLEEIWVAHDGGLHRSTNDGNSWVVEHKNMTIGEYYDIGVTELDDRMIMGSLDNSTHQFLNGSWDRISGGDGSSGLVFKSNSDFGIFNVNSGFALYNFTTQTSLGIKGDGHPHLGLNCATLQHPIYDNKVILGGAQLYMFELTGTHQDLNDPNITLGNLGSLTTFSNFPSDPTHNKKSDVTGIAMSYSDPSKAYASLSTNYSNYDTDSNGNGIFSRSLYKTTNLGLPWHDKSNNLIIEGKKVLDHGLAITDVVLSPEDDDEVYLSINGIIPGHFKVVKSTDGAESWVDFTGSLPNIVIHELEVLDSYPTDVLMAATDLGIYIRRLDGTSDWECFNRDLPPCIIKNMEVRYCSQELYVATHGHGVYKADISDIFDNEQETVVEWSSIGMGYGAITLQRRDCRRKFNIVNYWDNHKNGRRLQNHRKTRC